MKTTNRNEKTRKWRARRTRVRKQLARSDRPRLTVYRSAKHIYAQLVDAETGNTIASASTRSKGIAVSGGTGNVEAAKKVGAAIAGLAKEKNVGAVVFNRNGFLYHGRVKALVEAAREAGLQL
jgi:large subunit ribosomal protein L18